jgi:uncharacterized membrane protein
LSPPDPETAPAEVAQQNIRTVAELERRMEEKRTFGERVSAPLVRAFGSMPFVVFHLVLFAAWFTVNLGWVPGVHPFDPFPFGILTLLLTSEGVFLAMFILIASNRLSRESDQRAHFDLQISLLAEAEVTKILRVLRDLSVKLGHDPHLGDAELADLAEPTDLPAIADTLAREIGPDATKE